MINAQEAYGNPSPASFGSINFSQIKAGSLTAIPPNETLQVHVSRVAGMLEQANRQAAELRYRLFGETEPQSPAACENAPLAPVEQSVAIATRELEQLTAQLSSILQRL